MSKATSCGTRMHGQFLHNEQRQIQKSEEEYYEITDQYILRTDRPATSNRPTADDRRPHKAHIWENFKWPYLREGSSDPLHVWFYGGGFEVGGSNGSISGGTTFNGYVGENNARGVIRLVTI